MMRRGRIRSFAARTAIPAALILVVATRWPLRERAVEAFPVPGSGAVAEWPTADGVGGTHYSELADINPANVASLEVAWTYRTGDVNDGKDGKAATAFEATPVMVDGVLYLSTPGSRVVALDAETGRRLWSFDPDVNRSAQSLVASRGVSVWLDPERRDGDPCRRRVFLAALDARLFALDARDGRPCTGFGDRGQVDLGAGVDRIEGRRADYQETAPPSVVNGLVIVGSKISDSKFADAPSGVVRAFDARTGERFSLRDSRVTFVWPSFGDLASPAFAERLFGLYVGPTPIQDDIKAGVVARAGEVIK